MISHVLRINGALFARYLRVNDIEPSEAVSANGTVRIEDIADDIKEVQRGAAVSEKSCNLLWEPPRGWPREKACRSPPGWCLLAWVQHVQPPSLPPPSRCRRPPLKTVRTDFPSDWWVSPPPIHNWCQLRPSTHDATSCLNEFHEAISVTSPWHDSVNNEFRL